uniref:PCNA-interacting partner n=1 Tax=Steinernema glaseri TaxID=37863 RepID=A0A1I7YC36_9BILA
MKLLCRNDTELILTIYRLTSEVLDARPLVLGVNRPLVQSLERITNQSNNWKLGEWDLHSLLDSVFASDHHRSAFSSSAEQCSVSVSCERENEWVDEQLSLKINVQQDTLLSNNDLVKDVSLKKGVDLLVSVLSAALANTDSFSVMRLFGHVCPDILPTAKRLAASSQLTMLQTILSYLMKLEIDGGEMEEEALKQHDKTLRSFNTTLDRIEGQLCEEGSTKRIMQKVLDIAAEWALSVSTLSSEISCSIHKASQFCKSHIDTIIKNFNALSKNPLFTAQRRPAFINNVHISLRLLIDRLTLFDTVTLPNAYATPAFRTPVVRVQTPKAESSAAEVEEEEEASKAEKDSSSPTYPKFLNFDTPSASEPVKEVCTETAPVNEEDTQNSIDSHTTPVLKKPKAPGIRKGRSRISAKPPAKLFPLEEEEPVDSSPKKKRKSDEPTKPLKPAKQGRKSEPTTKRTQKKTEVPKGQRKITSFFGGK